ncbi:RNA polymerase sigma factor [Fulvivirga ligni]|uniref:RNA polymerase sigma factor n=1 Tax=Fulvivirga ligni TaxID=2904246 RepID=UPI001F2AAAD4|nr:sigma-70 family RNA polymerase sigma factor [Fulvivirga ligni]UII20869.1 sigma-70 family RNA polymerase sigma factor [Fulvivirga ligni]
MDRIHELANLVKDSDQHAFNSLFDLFWEPMQSYAYSLIQDDAIAQDLLQEVWIDYWKRRRDIHTDNIKGYLYKAIRYKCFNHLRNTKLSFIQLEIANAIAIEPTVIEEENVLELSLKVKSILSKLPPRCQEIFILSRINELNNMEISKGLNISQRTVENQISYALKHLRKELEIVRMLFCL